MSTKPSKDLKTFPNPYKGRYYTVDMNCPEFTSVCPITGRPDFGTIKISYVPAGLCIELKSLKLYIWSYRDEGIFYEDVTNKILDDLVKACDPVSMTVKGEFSVRGGITTSVTATYNKEEEA